MHGVFPVRMLAAMTLLATPLAAWAEDWKAAANQRIEQHRKGDFTITLVGPTSQPVTDAPATATQTRSHFLFGTAVAGHLLAADTPDARRYRDFITQHFSGVVSENDMKWYSTEKERGQVSYAAADRYSRFAAEHGLRSRGHCLFWDREKFIQAWVQALPADELRAAVEARLDSIVPRYKGQVFCWDVNNEMLDGGFYQKHLGPDAYARLFKRAHELDPTATLFVNEFGILGSDAKRDRYLKLIRDLQAQGAPVTGIGIQEHACERIVLTPPAGSQPGETEERKDLGGLTPQRLYADLDRLAELKLPIHLTEISCKTRDPQKRADGLEALFRVGFSHPGVEAILVWGFWEKAHWLGKDAALVAADWSLLPAGQRLSDLLLKEWRTRAEARTDARGQLTFRGFYGTYTLSVTGPDGRTLTGTATLTPEQRTATVTLK